MKPENILQSDVLDLLFENRNKTYGAYELRKHYNKRLTKSIAITVVLVIIFAILQSWKMPRRKGSFMLEIPDAARLVTYNIPKDIPKKPVVPARKQPKQIAAVRYQAVVVVPDNKVFDTLPTITDLNSQVISDKNIAGEEVAYNEVIAPPLNGTESRGEIEEKEAGAASEIFISAEVMPQFPGGVEAYKKFMLRNLKQPDNIDEGQKFVVIAKFVVAPDGSISNIDIVQNGRADLDKEVMRVIKMMPKWIPGRQNGVAVPVYFRVPVTFVPQE